MSNLFSSREIRGAMLFLLIMGVVVGVAIFWTDRRDDQYQESIQSAEVQITDTTAVTLREFDPNTATYADLRALGLDKSLCVSLIKYREGGKIFRIEEDVALCYGMTDSLYEVLMPYIKIAPEYRIKPSVRNYEHRPYTPRKKAEIALSEFMIDTVSAEWLHSTGAFSIKQAQALIRWRDLSGIHSTEELRGCYVVSDSIALLLEPYVIYTDNEISQPKIIEINTADSATLLSVVGIGPKSLISILEYRKRLGGFHNLEQLSEVDYITESNFEKILKQISCDSCEIQKIDINFASQSTLGQHPYIGAKTLRKLMKIRLLKGGWRSTEELIDDKIINEEQAKKLAPYLQFRDFERP